MVTVKVRMFGTLKEALGKIEGSLTLPGEVDVAWIIRELTKEYGESFEEAFIEIVPQSPLPNVLILLNDVDIYNLKELRTRVRDGDTLTFLPVSHGG